MFQNNFMWFYGDFMCPLAQDISQVESHSTSFHAGITHDRNLVPPTQAIRSLLLSALGSMLMREVLPEALSYPTDSHFTLCHSMTPKYRTTAQASESLDSVSIRRERNINIRSKI